MSFLEDISQKIVENSNKIIEYPISIMNERGFIIGSTNLNRLGKFNKVSVDVLKEKKQISYKFKDVEQLKDTYPGVAIPIIINKKSIGVLGLIGNPKDVEKYAQLLSSHVELMCHEYLKKEKNELESKTLNNFMNYLLTSKEEESLYETMRYSRVLGLNLTEDIKRVSILIEYDLNTENIAWGVFQNNALSTIESYLSDNKNDMISFLNLDQFIVVKAINPKETPELFMKTLTYQIKKLKEFLNLEYNLNINVSIGRIAKGVNGIKKSYQDALEALVVGKKNNVLSEIYHYNNLNIILVSMTNDLSPFVREKIMHRVESFINHDNFPTLSNTFLNYCEYNLNLSKTARKLFIHRNSLVYRLEKINELTSLDTSNFEHCLLLYIIIVGKS